MSKKKPTAVLVSLSDLGKALNASTDEVMVKELSPQEKVKAGLLPRKKVEPSPQKADSVTVVTPTVNLIVEQKVEQKAETVKPAVKKKTKAKVEKETSIEVEEPVVTAKREPLRPTEKETNLIDSLEAQFAHLIEAPIIIHGRPLERNKSENDEMMGFIRKVNDKLGADAIPFVSHFTRDSEIKLMLKSHSALALVITTIAQTFKLRIPVRTRYEGEDVIVEYLSPVPGKAYETKDLVKAGIYINSKLGSIMSSLERAELMEAELRATIEGLKAKEKAQQEKDKEQQATISSLLERLDTFGGFPITYLFDGESQFVLKRIEPKLKKKKKDGKDEPEKRKSWFVGLTESGKKAKLRKIHHYCPVMGHANSVKFKTLEEARDVMEMLHSKRVSGKKTWCRVDPNKYHIARWVFQDRGD